jgi:hypothetical protein
MWDIKQERKGHIFISKHDRLIAHIPGGCWKLPKRFNSTKTPWRVRAPPFAFNSTEAHREYLPFIISRPSKRLKHVMGRMKIHLLAHDIFRSSCHSSSSSCYVYLLQYHFPATSEDTMKWKPEVFSTTTDGGRISHQILFKSCRRGTGAGKQQLGVGNLSPLFPADNFLLEMRLFRLKSPVRIYLLRMLSGACPTAIVHISKKWDLYSFYASLCREWMNTKAIMYIRDVYNVKYSFDKLSLFSHPK